MAGIEAASCSSFIVYLRRAKVDLAARTQSKESDTHERTPFSHAACVKVSPLFLNDITQCALWARSSFVMTTRKRASRSFETPVHHGKSEQAFALSHPNEACIPPAERFPEALQTKESSRNDQLLQEHASDLDGGRPLSIFRAPANLAQR